MKMAVHDKNVHRFVNSSVFYTRKCGYIRYTHTWDYRNASDHIVFSGGSNMTKLRWTSLVAGASFSAMLLTGCGESAPTKKGAAKELEQAQDLVDAGTSNANSKDYATALVQFNNAKSRIEEARPNATSDEMRTLNSLADTVRRKISDTEYKKMTDTKPAVKPVDDTIRKEEEEEKKKAAADKKKAEEEAKKAAEQKAKLEKALTQHDTGSGKKDDDTGAAGLPPTKTAGGDKKPDDKGGDKPKGDKGDEAAAEPKEDPNAIEKAKPPYPAVTDKSEEVEVIKIGTRGKYVWAYFQVFNKSEDGKRISTVAAYFKDKDNQSLIDERGVAVFPFEGFRDSNKDMFSQGSDALTLGSATVDGRAVKRFVAVGEHESRAKDVKKATVKVIFQEGGAPYATGPK